MEILISLLIIAVVVWFLFWVIDAVPVPAPMNMIAKVIVAILAFIKVIQYLK